ncbi:MAG: signal peptidase I [Candidatus Omnitrophica bacterium]|nr:signal peptidase I [Candidatus Omnitrophota bacterium]
MDNKVKAVIKEYAESLLIAFVLAMIIRTFVVQAFKIPTGSMRPTLIEGDRILVNKFIYKFRDPKRGEVIVFKYPEDTKLAFIKRLIGLSNESLEIKNGRIFINDNIIDDKNLRKNYYYNRGDYGEGGQKIEIPDDALFALGDNSANSRDSRYWGFVPRKNLIGKAMLVYWPPYRMRIIE